MKISCSSWQILSHQALYDKNNSLTKLFFMFVLFSVKPSTGNFPPDNSCFSLKFLHRLWTGCWGRERGEAGDSRPRSPPIHPTSPTSFNTYLMPGFHHMLLLPLQAHLSSWKQFGDCQFLGLGLLPDSRSLHSFLSKTRFWAKINSTMGNWTGAGQ